MLPSLLNKIYSWKRYSLSKAFYIFSLFILTFSFPSFSQVYPVQLSTQLLPPYSGYLPDYGDPTNEKLKCIIMLNDFSVTHRDVKLEITITGNGFTIKTNPTFFPTPITIYPGMPEIISGIDLAPYLETQNLDFTGINVNDYEQRKVLPEGQYSICIKVIDYYHPDYTVLSNESCSYAWFFLADPPFLNFPLCNSNITPTQPQNIFFQWTPMNLSSPNSVLNTEYLFELFEVRPASTPPNDIVLTTAPIFSITTSNAFYNYGIADPILYTGMEYVWRVRAIDLSGRDYFKNDGYSQICTFSYGNVQNTFGEDAFSLTLNGQASTHRQIKWWWNNIANFTKYKLQIRKTGTQNWFDYFTNASELKISPLEPSTSYEARVMGMGEGIESDWSNTVTVNTNPPPTIVCNDQNIPINALSAQPLLAATPYMIMKIGQFEMYVTSISPFGNSPGRYSGHGYILYYFKKIGVAFDNVYINDNLEITDGNVVALTQGIDAWVDNWILEQAMDDPHHVDGTITTVYLNEDSSIVVVNDLGDTTVLSFPTNDHLVVIQDDAGNQYIVYPDGTIVPGTYLEFSTDTLEATKNNQIVFEKSSEQVYGFDGFVHGAWHEDYEVILLSDQSKYYIPNKSLEKNKTDIVRAKINPQLYSTPVIQFKNQLGTSISHSVVNDSIFEISLPASQENYAVYAYAGNLRLGKLNVKVYELIEKNIYIVPLVGATLPDLENLQNEINSVFHQGVCHLNLSIKSEFNSTDWDNNHDGLLESGNYNLLQDYSSEMKKLSSQWINENEIEKEDYILFIVPSFDNQNVDKGGYMPLGRHKGFIKSGSTARVYAHEMAHGLFGLQHTFPTLNEGSTENLLDYSSGKNLATYQWEKMRQKWSQFNLFDDEDAGSYQLNFVDINDLISPDIYDSPENYSCNQFLSKFNKIIVFSEEQKSKIDSYVLVNGKIKGVYSTVDGVSRYFNQAHSVEYINNNGTITISSAQYNPSFICFDCLFENCKPTNVFNDPTLCQKMEGEKVNGTPQWIYKNIPEKYIFKLDALSKDCIAGESVIEHIENGNPICKTLQNFNCDENLNNNGYSLTGLELVEIEPVENKFYDCSTSFGWINLYGKAILPLEFTKLAADGYVVGFEKNGKEYVACYFGGTNSIEEQHFYAYVDKELFNQKEATLNSSNEKIRVMDLTDEILFLHEDFNFANINDEIHYRNYDSHGCYFEYSFPHDGRLTYEFDGYQFENVTKTIYWRNSCAFDALSSYLCQGLVAGVEDLTSFLSILGELPRIPESIYNPASSNYNSIFLNAYTTESATNWDTQNESDAIIFAFLCGIYNGVAEELDELDKILPLITRYLCDGNFRQEINSALSQIEINDIKNLIAEDFQGNIYQQTESLGRYTIKIAGVVFALSKINWSAKLSLAVGTIKSLPKNIILFVNKAKSQAIHGIELIKGNVQKFVFYNALQNEIELVRFADDGLIIFNDTRMLSQTPENAIELFSFGEIPYKTLDDATQKIDNLKLVKTTDGEIWVVKETQQIFLELQYKPSWLNNRTIKTNENTVTIIGSYRNDIKYILEELNYPQSTNFGPKNNNFNLLNVPEGYNPSTFWEDFNQPWLDAATKRKDEIFVTSDPFDNSILFKSDGTRTGFGKEIEFMTNLVQQGEYYFSSSLGKYLPIN